MWMWSKIATCSAFFSSRRECNTWYHSTFGSKFLVHFVPHHEVKTLERVVRFSPETRILSFRCIPSIFCALCVCLRFYSIQYFIYHFQHNSVCVECFVDVIIITFIIKGENICQKQTEFFFVFSKKKYEIHPNLQCPITLVWWKIFNWTYCCCENGIHLICEAFYFWLESDICHNVQLKLHFPSVLLHSNLRMSDTRWDYHSYFLLVAFGTNIRHYICYAMIDLSTFNDLFVFTSLGWYKMIAFL